MQFHINTDQRRAEEWGLSLPEAFLFSYLHSHIDWARDLGDGFRWVAKSVMMEQVPLAATSDRTTTRLLKSLREKGLIETSTLDGLPAIRVTDKGQVWLSPAPKVARGVAKSPNRRQVPRQVGEGAHAKVATNHINKTIIETREHITCARERPHTREGGTPVPEKITEPKPSIAPSAPVDAPTVDEDPPSSSKKKAASTPSVKNGYTIEFDELWSAYPRREGGNPKKRAYRAYIARLREGVTHEEIKKGVHRYAEHIRASKNEGTRYVLQAATFFGPDERWAEEYDTKKRPIGTPHTAEDFAAIDYGPAPIFKF